MNICSLILVFLLNYLPSNALYSAEGKASFYADRMHGQRTASGERYDKTKLTAAHATLAFDTHVRVTNRKNGKSVIVRINDRMPKSRLATIDLSRTAAQQIDLIQTGIAAVKLQELDAAEVAQQDAPADVSEVTLANKD
ncbi:septal ring lytic transglycosylase RlpA family protein [Pontibacter roseus]|uniref:septal ring lytic transglycosylase RlpA family protein n=1 Tax=Pontibacter roseus TaxID=336989 RepID=UPI000367C09D|nr:septal ring lytic transglycosylase RlpA family protein [Pontibacter roseus]